MRWGSIIINYDSSDNVEYVSRHTQPAAPESSDGWYIKKFTWTAGNPTRVEELRGAHTNRAHLSWT